MLNLKKLISNKKENILNQNKSQEKDLVLSSDLKVDKKFKLNKNKSCHIDDMVIEEFNQNPFTYPLNQTTFFYSLKFELSNFYPSIIRYENNQFYFHQSFLSINMKDEIEKSAKVDNPLIFISNEQFFMWCKAMFFKDKEMMEKILNFNQYNICQKFISKTLTAQDIIKNEEYTDEWQKIQMGIKACGKKVKNFDEEKWNKVKEDFMLNGLRLKFFTNNDLKEKLLNTKSIIAEASPKDFEWGIGMSIYDIKKHKEQKIDFNNMHIEVKGKNLLGKCLMRIKESLKSIDGLF